MWVMKRYATQVIGLRGTPGHGSLREWGVAYRELPLAEDGDIDWEALSEAITPRKPWWNQLEINISDINPCLPASSILSYVQLFC